jgi:murein L,D-transpeptidase YcbB/YkuD
MLLAGIGCKNSDASNKIAVVPAVDTSITKANAAADVFIDSLAVYDFIHQQALNQRDSAYMLGFYRQRNYQQAWFSSLGLSEQAFSFINLYRNYRSSVADSVLYVAAFDALADKWISDSIPYKGSREEVVAFELMLTRYFFKYAERAYKGNREINPADLGWFIPRKKINPVAFLDSVLIQDGRDIQAYLPVHPIFEKLRKSLVQYTALSRQPWQPLAYPSSAIARGDSSGLIRQIKQRLIALGDLATTDTGGLFTLATAGAVAHFQQRHGLEPDSMPGKGFFEALNVSPAVRMRQILINMERARWVPKPGNGAYLVVNIPEFRLHVFDSGKKQFDMAAVVGKPATNTVIFNGDLKYVVLAPYWNVPYSIVKNEMGRTPSYFAKRNMEVIGKYADGLPMVRQKPGGANALGRVKFLFPNSYSIYLHDTPSKGAFGQQQRAFSHGCIRLAQPVKLAEWLLRNDPNWPPDKMAKTMQGSKEVTVTIAKPVPVFIGYFTCWVNDQGAINFRKDLYGHDKKMESLLFHSPQ